MNQSRGQQPQGGGGRYDITKREEEEEEVKKGYPHELPDDTADDAPLLAREESSSPTTRRVGKTGRPVASRRPALIVMSLSMMAMFVWLGYLLLFLAPSTSAMGKADAAAASSVPQAGGQHSRALGEFAIQKILVDSAGVFGLHDGNNNPTLSPSSSSSTTTQTKARRHGDDGDDDDDDDDDRDHTSSQKEEQPALKKSQHRASWMSLVPDSTPLSQLNIPGTHDSATWNFSQATRDAIRHNADPARRVAPADVYRCQRVSLVDALERGVRFFDLRYGLDPDGVRLVFYHAHALLSELATVEDVLFGFYEWLERRPTEVVLLSFKIESTGINLTPQDNIKAQALLQHHLTTPAARHYIHQRRDALGTLGSARGKVVLLRRFDIPAASNPRGIVPLPGIHLPPARWPVNAKKGFSLLYNPRRNLSAHIEDYYEPHDLGFSATAAEVVQAKLDAVEANLRLAAAAAAAPSTHALKKSRHGDDDDDDDDDHAEQKEEEEKEEEEEEEEGTLFITFTSAEHDLNKPPVTPRIMALGNGSDTTPLGGVNRRLVREILPDLRGKRVGIVIIDFWDWDTEEDGDEGVDVVGEILDL